MPRCARVGAPPIVHGPQRFSSPATLGPGAQGRTAGSPLSLRASRSLQPSVPGLLEIILGPNEATG